MTRTPNTYATVQDIADEFSVSRDAVYRRVESGEWPAGRVGRMIRFSPEDQETIRDQVAQSRRSNRRRGRIADALARANKRAA